MSLYSRKDPLTPWRQVHCGIGLQGAMVVRMASGFRDLILSLSILVASIASARALEFSTNRTVVIIVVIAPKTSC